MIKSCLLLLLSFAAMPGLYAQCLLPLPSPACNATEPLVLDNETLDAGITKWYYGAPVIMNSLTLNGGTLVVCGDLTIDKFYMSSGTIHIRPGARFVIGSGIGAGLVLAGNAYIFNYGTCEIQRNLSLDNGATAANPNVVINATPSSVLKLSNQYFVINNPHSWFVNNGHAEFWGIITDAQASPGSVCLGDESSTRMAVLINKVADTYRVPAGTACLNVYQFSQFSNRLTSDPSLHACLGSSHSSYSGCGGCPANNWGAAQVFTACAGCDALTVLGMQFSSFTVQQAGNGAAKLEWQMPGVPTASFFEIKRSADGRRYQVIDSMRIDDESKSSFHFFDKHPLPGKNYYMISFFNPATATNLNSRPVPFHSLTNDAFTVYPAPFDNEFFVSHREKIQQVILTDLTGRNIPIRYETNDALGPVAVTLVQPVQPGIYLVHIRTERNIVAKTIFKD